MRTAFLRLVSVLLVAFCSGCATLDYDLSRIELPISAKPADVGASEVQPFRIEAKHTLWVHGLLGRSKPDVVALVAEKSAGFDRIAGFRVTQSGSFHDWLLTHLTGTIIRMKSVVIEGQLVRDSGR